MTKQKDDLRKRMLKLQSDREKPKGKTRVFETRTANKVLSDSKQSPKPKRLCGNLMIQGELTVLFGPTNSAKSVFATQIAESIASGIPINEHLELDLVEGGKVLLIDFELTDKQFEGRYSVENPDTEFYEHHYQFSNNLLRVAPQKSKISPEEIEERGGYLSIVIEEITELIAEYKPAAVILDNITYLSGELEKAKEAVQVVSLLRSLCDANGMSVLVLGHTPKRDRSKPIEPKDIAGSAMLGNFIDAAFAISKSAKDDRVRYVKQVKVRSAPMEFGEQNVLEFQIRKPFNFLELDFLNYTKESEHLLSKEDGKKEIDDVIMQMLLDGALTADIVEATGVNRMRVKRMRERIEQNQEFIEKKPPF